MHTVSLEYAKNHLTELLVEVAAGEDIVIESNSRPLARLVAERDTSPQPNTIEKAGAWPFMGLYHGQMKLSDGWDEDLPPEIWDALKP